MSCSVFLFHWLVFGMFGGEFGGHGFGIGWMDGLWFSEKSGMEYEWFSINSIIKEWTAPYSDSR